MKPDMHGSHTKPGDSAASDDVGTGVLAIEHFAILQQFGFAYFLVVSHPG
jgi:hypothetical protein